ncbi:helix-turn-helix domain-containing protein [Streptomyces sp. NPDC102259]|uniref:helix-turn-helix domain-containing protein n=1 Tax=Streptomyces sp. NPDC102259 TaxID=3366148 RepID=UPI003804059C
MAHRIRRVPPASLGPMLHAARLRTGTGLRATARAVGIAPSYLVGLESSERVPSRTVARQLADVLALADGERALLLAAAVSDAGRDYPRPRPVGDTRRTILGDASDTSTDAP